MEEMKGKIVQVSGPVIDVEFEGSYLPAIKDALYVIQDGKKKVMEVSQHTGNNGSAALCLLRVKVFVRIWRL